MENTEWGWRTYRIPHEMNIAIAARGASPQHVVVWAPHKIKTCIYRACSWIAVLPGFARFAGYG